MTRDFINDVEVNQVATVLQGDLDAYQKEIEAVADMDVLKLREDELMAEMKTFEEYLVGTKYDIPSSVDYEGVFYSKADIADRIVKFINKNEVEYQYTLGLCQLVKMWKDVKNITHIDYHKYDSTLRVLGQLRFKGYKEWSDILAVNKFFAGCHEQYVKDTSFQIYLSKKHNAIMDRMQALTAVDPATGDADGGVDIPVPAKKGKKVTKA